MSIAKDSDVMIHEATYIEGEKTLANNYHHSHIEDVFELIKQANVKRCLITHLSNRYNHENIQLIKQQLKHMRMFQILNLLKILIRL